MSKKDKKRTEWRKAVKKTSEKLDQIENNRFIIGSLAISLFKNRLGKKFAKDAAKKSKVFNNWKSVYQKISNLRKIQK